MKLAYSEYQVFRKDHGGTKELYPYKFLFLDYLSRYVNPTLV